MKVIVPQWCFVAVWMFAATASGGTREYVFSGPQVSGRLVMEEFTTPDSMITMTNILGPPSLFSVTIAGETFTTHAFALTVWNDFDAKFDAYWLTSSNVELRMIGPATINTNSYSSSLPAPLAQYEVHTIRFAENGGDSYEIDSMHEVPRLSFARTGNGLMLRWPSADTNFVLEAIGTLPASGLWLAVTNAVETIGELSSVTVEHSQTNRFFRLRRLE